MLITYSLYISLLIFAFGLLYRIFCWFYRKIGLNAKEISFASRIAYAVRGILGTVFSLKIIALIKVFVLDVLLQRKILKEDLSRWLMHILIFWGFMLLLLMHALDKILTSKILADYYSTLNPYMFLRDLFGMFVIIGVLISIYRRFVKKVPRLSTNVMDAYLIALVSVIMVSGIMLEGIKITSYKKYKEMADAYSASTDINELKSLEAYWVREFETVSINSPDYFSGANLKLGREIHENSCAMCHSNPRWAFTGFAAAKIIKPIARTLDESNSMEILLYIHFLAVFLGLAYLPFSKMLHIITTPLSLLANSVMDESSAPANIATKQMLELDACMHCGTCSLRCSALAASVMIGNSDILPSEKMQHIRSMANGRKLKKEELISLQEGVYICTNCDRCTVVCPAGINLRDLWFTVREELVHNGNGYPLSFMLSQLSFYRGLMKEKMDAEYYSQPINEVRDKLTYKLGELKSCEEALPVTEIDREFANMIGLSDDAGTYTNCFSCSTCTASCPVVQKYENPMDALGLLPHQIIHSAVLGLENLSLGSRMLWDCLTCYKCQDSCPQGVRITEVFYKLKNLAVKKNRSKIKDFRGPVLNL